MFLGDKDKKLPKEYADLMAKAVAAPKPTRPEPADGPVKNTTKVVGAGGAAGTPLNKIKFAQPVVKVGWVVVLALYPQSHGPLVS